MSTQRILMLWVCQPKQMSRFFNSTSSRSVRKMREIESDIIVNAMLLPLPPEPCKVSKCWVP
jgi:hypothetical protein